MPNHEVVVVPLQCAKCSKKIEIECSPSSGFAYMNFYAVDCPHCGERIHPQLPGDILTMRKVDAT